ncbi:MOSC domain-containing protein [Cohnella silvisoli]|uniref:MOSC domain-containing protein n=1 Tax=Cohnella silvisoli TaxID=2873699 RepID=A0ABV1KP15_9BACL|nr:MOSC domain-containing protein [Cohnella silvisoli]MCD9020950.1 MOSC domain-containing protein [Cohnella silvisoli]
MAECATLAVFPLLSVNIGRVQTGVYKGKEAQSGIGKSTVHRSVHVSVLGVEGDEQADLVNHGGPDKAICLYSLDHYPHWEEVLRRSLEFGSFGENFTVRNMNESDVRIGDIFHVGSAVVQVSQPRQPCWKLAMKWGLDELPLLITESGATGFYFRVLEAGEVKAGDELLLKVTHPARITVAEANRVMHKDKGDLEGIRRLLAVDALSASWVNTLTNRLLRLQST